MDIVDPLIGKTIGSYRVLRPLGKGGMGAIYEVEHTLIGKKAALKILHNDFIKNASAVERFFTEAKAVNKIRHQNIVDITDYGKTKENAPYFIMEFLDGKGLNKIVRESGAMELRRAFHITQQISSALKASHAAGVIHRDLKPENIFLIQMGPDPDFVKVFDFGVAKLLKDTDGAKPRGSTQSGVMLGTPSYMAPEQLLDSVGDQRTDIYSLGLIFYELLVGHRIVDGANAADIMVKVATEEIPPPSKLLPNLSTEFQAFLTKATQKDPKNRYQNMDEFCTALQEAETHAIDRGDMIPALINYQTYTKLAVRASQMNIPAITAAEVAKAEAEEKRKEEEALAQAAVVQAPEAPSQEPSSQEAPVAVMNDANTTLSLATGTMTPAGQSPKSYHIAFGVAALSMVLLGFMWTSLFQSPVEAPVKTIPVQVPASSLASTDNQPAVPIATKVKVEFVTDPPGATITKDKTILGKTPYTVEFDISDTEQTIRLTRKGFLPETKTFTTTADQSFAVTLTPEKKIDKTKTPDKPTEKPPEKKCRLKFLGGCPQ